MKSAQTFSSCIGYKERKNTRIGIIMLINSENVRKRKKKKMTKEKKQYEIVFSVYKFIIQDITFPIQWGLSANFVKRDHWNPK